MNRMPVSRLSWRPLALGGIQAPSRRSYGLGQPQAAPLVVEVVEATGNAVVGATVDIPGSQSGSVLTDNRGQAVFNVPPGNYTIRASYNGLVIVKKFTKEESQDGATAFLQFPVCIQGSLFRPIDLLIFGVAGGMIAAGTYWKLKPLEMTGEIALGAAVFGFIYRLQCM